MSRGDSEAMNCPVCGRTAPVGSNRRLGFHYAETTHSLRVCVAVDVRADDHRTVAQLQLAHRMALALDRLSVMVAAAAPVLERVAVAIEARTAVARASEERMAKSADDYLAALKAVDDSGPVPSLVDDDDGGH